MEETLQRLQSRSPFEAALQKSPFETATVQTHMAKVVCESSVGKEQIKMLTKDGTGVLPGKHRLPPFCKGQRTAPVPSPFDRPPPNIGRKHPAFEPSTSKCFDWQLVAKMGSSMEDVMSFVTRMSSQSIGGTETLISIPSTGNGGGSTTDTMSQDTLPSLRSSVEA